MEGGEEGRARDGVERAVEEEVFTGLWLAVASAHESCGFEMRLVGPEVASAGPKLCEERRLAARECRVEAGGRDREERW